jgi:ATP-binding cassette subfamily B protein
LRNIQEGLGGVRDILIDGTQAVYAEAYQKTNLALRRAVGNLQIISGIPRPLVEALAVMLIAVSAYIYSATNNGNEIGSSLPIFGVIAFAAQRSLPMMQQLFYSWANIQGGLASLADVIEFLERDREVTTLRDSIMSLDFSNDIQLADVNFKYPNTNHLVLHSVNLSIKKGSMVGIIGSSGSGKSTLVDILMGLISATSGSLLVDGQIICSKNLRAWQNNISHVSQAIYLSDKSIAENIAFGLHRNNIDYQRVEDVSKIAKISETIEKWPQKYDTVVGERGINISGGQRQRIGIARALYKKSQLIVLDEATSALDITTEVEVMRGIESLGQNITVIVVAHRLSTLKNCDLIFKIKDGRVVESGSPSEVLL